ncbi:PREDICTED: keratin, type I cytoskeletal 19-like [Nanorana parkeri]|uniref:keratin, type I cytoskeletal 19-like n=1 Tax=Nanorana parkeri TaxID=125878 RepID=UPI0008544AC1|nr:PREDICTED: keratin, type I cytoskeletal 19-like [Nanorana parkeri]
MSYKTFQPFRGFYRAGREYLGYPMYRSHTSSSDVKPKPYISHNVPYYRIHQVHVGSGGSGIRHSSSGQRDVMGNAHGFNRDHKIRQSSNRTGWTNSKLFNFDEKKTMQSLNGRLESYLENVKQMEEENVIIEKKICEWYEKHSGMVYPDFSSYLHTVTDLQDQILLATEQIASLVKQISNGHTTADDFRNKEEMNFKMRTLAEKDLCDHTGILETINMEKQNLNANIQNLEEELQQLMKTSEEEIKCLQAQLGTRVNVEVEMTPSIDLNKALSEIRKEYESHMERNLSDIESKFYDLTSELSMMSSSIDQLQQFSNEAIDLKLQKKTLEAELKKQMSMISVQNSTFMEINEGYSSQLKYHQDVIDINELQMEEIQSKVKQLNVEYELNANTKIFLEKEIATYKKHLEGQTTKYV